VTWCRQVADGVWLAVAWPRTPTPGTRRSAASPHERYLVDRAAADRAEAAARRTASGHSLDPAGAEFAVSRSHTLGVGAAIVAPVGRRLGVDLVAVARVDERHARVVLRDQEWALLAFAGGVRPALAWALKEAGAKASGDAMRWFPHGIVVGLATEGLCVRTVEDGTPLRASWKLFGNYLCAWIRD
jgi:phosphopantetheinyl transferase (holo-ACP synthase)